MVCALPDHEAAGITSEFDEYSDAGSEWSDCSDKENVEGRLIATSSVPVQFDDEFFYELERTARLEAVEHTAATLPQPGTDFLALEKDALYCGRAPVSTAHSLRGSRELLPQLQSERPQRPLLRQRLIAKTLNSNARQATRRIPMQPTHDVQAPLSAVAQGAGTYAGEATDFDVSLNPESVYALAKSFGLGTDPDSSQPKPLQNVVYDPRIRVLSHEGSMILRGSGVPASMYSLSRTRGDGVRPDLLTTTTTEMLDPTSSVNSEVRADRENVRRVQALLSPDREVIAKDMEAATLMHVTPSSHGLQPPTPCALLKHVHPDLLKKNETPTCSTVASPCEQSLDDVTAQHRSAPFPSVSDLQAKHLAPAF